LRNQWNFFKLISLFLQVSLLPSYLFPCQSEHWNLIFHTLSGESAFCNKDLLRSMARSKRGTPSSQVVINQNPKRWSILPWAISIDCLMTLTATTNTFDGRKFEHFLESTW
jgi:hypothetical protein